MSSRMNDLSQEDLAIVERIAKTGELDAMDKVEIVGLKTELGKELNGRKGIVKTISGEIDGLPNPYTTKMPDGRYKIEVDLEETIGKETRPGYCSFTPETKTYSLKRENLIMCDIQPGTFARDPEGIELLRRKGMNISSTAERDEAEPELAGFFPAIRWGDANRVRECMEVLKSRGCPDPANQMIDASGNTALIGAIEHGYADIAKILIEYGADCNATISNPMLRNLGITYFNMAITMFDKVESTGKAEEVVNILIDGGANVNNMTSRGTPLSAAVLIHSDHAARMRILRRLIDAGADPNQYISIEDGPGINQGLALSTASADELGNYSREDRLEVVQLLVDAGADPGLMVRLDMRGEACNIIHTATSFRRPDILKVFLSCEKGQKAVNMKREQKCEYPGENNGHGEVAITMAVAQDSLDQCKANREMAVQLLKAGADTNIEDHIGLTAAAWLRDNTGKKKELANLIKKAKKIKNKKDRNKFWDKSEEVKSFIEEGENDIAQCDNCGTCEDNNYVNGEGVKAFQRCSRCKKVHYCSRDCQKKRWRIHKKECAA